MKGNRTKFKITFCGYHEQYLRAEYKMGGAWP